MTCGTSCSTCSSNSGNSSSSTTTPSSSSTTTPSSSSTSSSMLSGPAWMGWRRPRPPPRPPHCTVPTAAARQLAAGPCGRWAAWGWACPGCRRAWGQRLPRPTVQRLAAPRGASRGRRAGTERAPPGGQATVEPRQGWDRCPPASCMPVLTWRRRLRRRAACRAAEGAGVRQLRARTCAEAPSQALPRRAWGWAFSRMMSWTPSACPGERPWVCGGVCGCAGSCRAAAGDGRRRAAALGANRHLAAGCLPRPAPSLRHPHQFRSAGCTACLLPPTPLNPPPPAWAGFPAGTTATARTCRSCARASTPTAQPSTRSRRSSCAAAAWG